MKVSESREMASPTHEQAPLRTPLVVMLKDDKFRTYLQKWTRRRTGHDEDAEDVLSVAVVRAIRRERSGEGWNPDGKITAAAHMLGFIKGALANRRQARNRQAIDPVEDIEAFAHGGISPADAVADRLETSLRCKLASEVHRELVQTGRDPIAVDILESVAAGVVEYTDVARRIHRTPDEVRAGLKRLARYAQGALDAFRKQARFQ